MRKFLSSNPNGVQEVLEKLGEVVVSIKHPTDKQVMFKTQRGAVINWYPTTGSIVIGGPEAARLHVERLWHPVVQMNYRMPATHLMRLTRDRPCLPKHTVVHWVGDITRLLNACYEPRAHRTWNWLSDLRLDGRNSND
jgi:hypothetical protein